MNKKFFLALTLMLNAAGLFAQQNFKYRAALPKTDSDGFYQISLLPPLVARAQNNLADLRIVDGAGKFVPYIFGNRLPVKNEASFAAFPEVKLSPQPDTATVFIADNQAHQTISELYLKLRNADVKRSVSLSGSDDLKHWYAIKENIGLTGAGSNTSGTYEQQLNFPSSTYRYFKIQISHQNKQPVAILQAGIYRQQQTVASVYEQLPAPMLSQLDSAGSSYVTLRFAEAYQVNKLHLNLLGIKYYRRPVNIYQVINGVHGLIAETEINSSRLPELYFSAKSQMLELQIVNGDNPALEVKGIVAYQSEQSLISYLKKGQSYYVLAGNEKATSPQYDLQFFTDSLQRSIKSIKPGAVTANPQYQNQSVPVAERTSPWLIWLAIAAVVAVLGLLTFKMMKEVNQRKEEEKGREEEV
ncbi:DUF3999 family protein [Mucilaginibacter paludis]|nr:DUF3999 family protein [Mucilaginibacter paludis]